MSQGGSTAQKFKLIVHQVPHPNPDRVLDLLAQSVMRSLERKGLLSNNGAVGLNATHSN